MAPKKPHELLFITEMMEQIFLHTDMRTLLTSAQQVCHYWHEVIQGSRALQEALFFLPVKEDARDGKKSIRNPLMEQYLWPLLFKKRLYTKFRDLYLERIPEFNYNSVDEEICLRKEASWRRMLGHQPPRSPSELFAGEIEPNPRLTFFRVKYTPEHGWAVVWLLRWGLVTGAMRPEDGKWTFYDRPRYGIETWIDPKGYVSGCLIPDCDYHPWSYFT